MMRLGRSASLLVAFFLLTLLLTALSETCSKTWTPSSRSIGAAGDLDSAVEGESDAGWRARAAR
jgi:hypothetical protein